MVPPNWAIWFCMDPTNFVFGIVLQKIWPNVVYFIKLNFKFIILYARGSCILRTFILGYLNFGKNFKGRTTSTNTQVTGVLQECYQSFLKQIYLSNQMTLVESFAQKHVKLEEKNLFVNCDKYMKLAPVSCFVFCVHLTNICTDSEIFCAIVWLHDCSF